MKKGERKIQIRRCGLCNKTGHNKTTCPQFLRTQNTVSTPKNATLGSEHPLQNKSSSAPLNFFVHHVNYNPHQSQHVVDLKTQHNNLWDQVQSSGPANDDDNYYARHASNRPAAYKKDPEIILPSFSPKTVASKIIKPTIVKQTKPIKPHREPMLKKTLVALQNKINKISVKKMAIAATLLVVAFGASLWCQSYFFDVKATAATIADNSSAGFLALQNSTSNIMSGNINGAQDSLVNALQNFDSAVKILENEHTLLQNIISSVPILDNQIKSRERLISAGQELSLGNTYLLKGLSEVQNNPSSTITQNLQVIADHLTYALPNYNKAAANLEKVDDSILPYKYQTSFKELRILFNAYLKDLNNLSTLSQSLQEVFGGTGLRRYLIIFQNPAEIRPTGGFMGSFALIDIENGQIVKMDVPAGGSYDLQGQLSEYVEPPTPLLLTNNRWEFQDANWFPDFPASAQKIAWFYRHSRKVTVDGVISINATVLNRLLSIMGSVTEKNKNITLTSDNAISTIQNIVEYGPDKKINKPKQIITDLAPNFIDYLKNVNPTQIIPILSNLQDALNKKEIMAYFTDEKTEQTVKSFGWSGQILPTEPKQDYLFVVNTNIQGQKSDAKIQQNISHQALIQVDGSIIDSVIITRKHTGQAGEQMYGQTNIDYMRVYAPAGSQLISASGFNWPDEQKFRAPLKWCSPDILLKTIEQEITIDANSGTRVTNEFNKTSFGNWIITEPEQTSQVQLIYKLPFKAWEENIENNAGKLTRMAKIFANNSLNSRYQLVVQKQSGVESEFESQIIYPEGWKPIWQDGLNINLATNGAYIKQDILSQDSVWGLVSSQSI